MNYMMDPTKFMEMQANYLRFLASCMNEQSSLSASSSVQNLNQSFKEDFELETQAAKPLEEQPSVQPRAQPLQETYSAKPQIPAKEDPKVLNFSPPRSNPEPKLPKSANPPIRKKNDPDEVPVAGNGKTFEELLEEEMKRNSQPSSYTPPPEKPKKEFLKRKSQKMPLNAPKPNIENPKKKLKEPKEPKESKEPKQTFKAPSPEPEEIIVNLPEEKKTPATPKPFLKRGEGQLCTQKKTVSKPPASRPSTINSRRTESETSFFEEEIPDLISDNHEDLNLEVKKYKQENEKLKKLKKELTEKKQKLNKEAEEFQKYKQKEKENLEKWKQEEIQKMKKERKVYERNFKAQTTKSESEEIAKLKATIQEVQNASKQKETKLRSHIENLKTKIKQLTERNQELESYINQVPNTEPQKPIEAFTPQIQCAQESMSENSEDNEIENQVVDEDGKIQTFYKDGRREIVFNNGVKKEIYPDGYIQVHFNNNDVKQTFPDGKVVYFFSETDTLQTTFPDGLQLFKFSNGQVEKHYPDGTKEISFPDGTVKCIFADGEEESIFPDGTVQKVDVQGIKYIDFVNGQKDTILPDGTKIREFPDGRVRKILTDGRVLQVKS